MAAGEALGAVCGGGDRRPGFVDDGSELSGLWFGVLPSGAVGIPRFGTYAPAAAAPQTRHSIAPFRQPVLLIMILWGGTMQDAVSKAERYRKEANKYGDLAK